MSFSEYGDLAAKTSVAAVLGSSKLLKIKDFTYNGPKFRTSDLAHMYHEVSNPNGKLNVKVKTNSKFDAFYQSKGNTLYLRFVTASDLTKQALVVHEVTHALFDFKMAKMDIATSEAIAYIVQCQYARANSTSDDPDVRLWDDGDDDWVFDIGWRIAGKLLSGGSIDSTDEADMRQAVRKNSKYHKEYTDMADFDGM